MKILCIDTGANALDWLMRCQDAGHEVLWYIKPRKDGTENDAGRGMVPRLFDYEALRKKWIGWADLIFLPDNAFYLELLEPYRKIGYPVFGPSPAAADLELNRRIGQEAMAECGLNTIPGVAFDDYDKAAKFVEKNPNYLVSKPSGDADKALSYVADDAASLIHMLVDRWKKNDKYRSDARKHGFILQEKKTGCEMAVGGWFGPGGWSRWWYENFEHKKLMANNLGPNTGEMGTLSMYVRSSKLAELALKPFTQLLTDLGYVGFIDIAGMIDKSGQFWPFEFTTRPGWPTFHNQVATHLGDPAQWMCDLLDGRDTLQAVENVACVSVVVAIPDFPYSHLTNKEVSGIPVYGCGDREHVHLSEVKLSEAPCQLNGKVFRGPCVVSAGDYIAVVTGTGDTITGARRSAYAAVKKIRMPNDPFYRPDIGRYGMEERLEIAKRHGFAKHFAI